MQEQREDEINLMAASRQSWGRHSWATGQPPAPNWSITGSFTDPSDQADAVTLLTGTGRLADDLYLLSHHEQTGKPHLQPRALGLGLASGLLGELMLAQSLRLWRGMVIVGGGTPPEDGLARSVLKLVNDERDNLPPRGWLLFLARTAAADVAGRLEQAGYLNRIAPRRFSRTVRWVPVDADSAFAPVARVKSALRASGPIPLEYAALGSLATACGLGHHLALYLPPNATARLEAAASLLDPELRELAIQTRAVVDSATLSHRT